MMHPSEVILQLEATNSRLEKEAIIQAAWDAGCTEFFVGVQQALDNLITYGVQKVPLILEDDQASGTFTWREFQELAHALGARTLTGHAARDALRAAAESCEFTHWNAWYRRLLLKDLKAGVTEKTINTVLARNGAAAKKYLVPVFSCQLAKSAADHPKKLKGIKWLDNKHDGVRLLTVVEKSGTVTQYTRNGIINTNFGHIAQQLAGLADHLTESVVLDGEMISTNFQALMTQVNRKEHVDTSDSRLMLFDIIPLTHFRAGEYAVHQRDRHAALCELIPLLDDLTSGTVQVEPKLEVDLDTPEGLAQMQEFNRTALEHGYEGIMIKDPDAAYRTKRSDAWLKSKPFETYDLVVTHVEPGKSGTKYEHTMGAVWFEGSDAGRKISVSVGSGWSDSDRDAIWSQRDTILGQIGEVKTDVLTLSQSGDTWSMRFPVFMRWRGFSPGEKI
jgi:DNA ligase 1